LIQNGILKTRDTLLHIQGVPKKMSIGYWNLSKTSFRLDGHLIIMEVAS